MAEILSCIFLTGTTGFLGKVVLEELFRRRDELQFGKIIILIRPKRGQDPRSRFFKELVPSPCFSKLPVEWVDLVQVVEGDLSDANCGLNEAIYEKLCSEITHIIHCAASVKFDLPVAEAALPNITSTLNIYDFAESCPKLRRLVITSTAYVTPHTSAPINEVLAPLPWPAAQLFENIQNGGVNEKEMLRATGHPNTYTLTKCIAEHLIMERKGDVPVTIVRPSIISASLKYPSPGWIDSPATLAGFIISLGLGLLRVVDGNLKVVLDIVPVDRVARTLIDETLLRDRENSRSKIVYAVATLKHGLDLESIKSAVWSFFNGRQIFRRAKAYYCGPRNLAYYFHDFLQHKIPFFLVRLYYAVRRDKKGQKQAERGSKMVSALNRMFPYFLHHTFDFRPREKILEELDAKEYLDLVCLGVEAHLMSKYR